MTIAIHHRVDRPDLGLGLVRVEGIEVAPATGSLQTELDRWIAERKQRPLHPDEEKLRQGCREVLRNGRYRATGRGKPASEYLMRAASEEVFPRLNGPVDANNLVSLAYCVPISLWDVALAGSDEVEFRLGRAGESYVFNATGQVLALEDLVCGCALGADGSSRPVVTPIKDSMASKIRGDSREVAGCIYYPLTAGSEQQLQRITDEFLRWLLTCGGRAGGQCGLCLPGQSVKL